MVKYSEHYDKNMQSDFIRQGIGMGMILCLFGCSASPVTDTQQDGGKASSSCMDRIIALDDSLGRLRNHSCEQGSLSESISHYANGLEALDYSGCPEAFVTAFHNHIQAWRAIQPFTASYSDLRGEMHDLFDELAHSPDSLAFQSHLEQIWSTWAEIEKAMQVIE